MALLALDGTLRAVNRAAEQLLGWTREELIGQHYRTISTPTSAARAAERTRRYLAGNAQLPRTFMLDLVRKDTSQVRVEACIQTLRDPTGQPLGFLGVYRDLSERDEAERTLREVADTVRDMIYVLSAPEGTITSLSPAFTTVTGWQPEEKLGERFLSLVHPEDQARAMEVFHRLFAQEQVDDFELRIQAKSGAYLVGEFSAMPRTRNGEVVGVLGIGRDITKRKQEDAERQAAESQLRESELLRERIVETMPEVLYVFDLATQHLVYVNRQMLSVLGYTPEAVRGLTVAQLQALVHSEDAARVAKLYRDFIAATGEEMSEGECRVRHHNGEWRWLHSRVTVFKRTPEGHPLELLGMAQDITDRKRLEERLHERAIQPKEMPERLKRFRESLGMTQVQFGQEFGGYNQRQMSGYETGQNDVPLELLLAIRAKGYPLEAILGHSPTAVLEKTATYFSAMRGKRLIAQRLAAALATVLAQDIAVIDQAVEELHVPVRDLDSSEQQLLEQLTNFQKEKP
jgi:PAS domain S-box-containing protein